MKTRVWKAFWIWNYKKEEAWLNEMSARGLHLVAPGFCNYLFEEGLPGAYTVRLDFLSNSDEAVTNRQYVGFLEETGAEYLGKVGRWAYFRKETAKGAFVLYSDIDSQIRQLSRLLGLVGILGGINLYNSAFNFFMYYTSHESVNLWIGLLCLCVGLLLGYGFLRFFQTRAHLRRERTLRE